MKEIRRKLLHIFVVGALAVFVWFAHPAFVRLGLVALLFFGILLSLLEKRKRILGVSAVLDLLERTEDRKKFPGKSVIMLVAGALVAHLFFNNLLVVTGLLVVMVGDSIAHIFGKQYGKIAVPWDRTKHLEGRIVGLLATFLVTILLWETIFISVNYWIVFAGIFVGMLIESLPLRKIGLDDNLVVPFVTALTIYVLTPTLV